MPIKNQLIGTSLFLLTMNVIAQDCGCDRLLAQDITSYQWDQKTMLHYLNTIDQSDYQSTASKTALAGSALIEAIPVGLNVDFSDFLESRTRFFRQEQFSATREESLNYLRSTLRSDQLTAYNTCLSLCLGTPGFYAKLEDETANAVVIKLEFRDLPGGTNKATKIQVIPNETLRLHDPNRDAVPAAMMNGAEAVVQFDRITPAASVVQVSYTIGSTTMVRSVRIPNWIVLPKYKLVELDAHEAPPEELKQHPEQVVVCFAQGDGDYEPGYPLYPSISGTKGPDGKPAGIFYGYWQNGGCKREDTSWFLPGVGSCGTGVGNGTKGCRAVKAYVVDVP